MSLNSGSCVLVFGGTLCNLGYRLLYLQGHQERETDFDPQSSSKLSIFVNRVTISRRYRNLWISCFVECLHFHRDLRSLVIPLILLMIVYSVVILYIIVMGYNFDPSAKVSLLLWQVLHQEQSYASNFSPTFKFITKFTFVWFD